MRIGSAARNVLTSLISCIILISASHVSIYSAQGSFIKLVSIAIGGNHYVGLSDNGSVYTWGGNESGQLGNGTKADCGYPTIVKGISSIVSISAGNNFTMVLKKDGTVWAWGDNSSAQLGIGSINNKNKPVQIKKLENVIAITAYGAHSIAVTNDGTVWQWGDQVTYGSRKNTYPVRVEGLKGIIRVAACEDHNLAIRNDGTVWIWCWDDLFPNTTKASQVKGIDNVKAITAGNGSSIALKKDGTVWLWKNNLHEQKSSPEKINGLPEIMAISSGNGHNAVLAYDRSIWTWGNNDYGQLGDGSTISRNKPERILSVKNAAMVAAYGNKTIVLTKDSSVYGCGWMKNTGSAEISCIDKAVNVIGLNDVVMVSSSYSHSLALKKDGTVYAWGCNQYGELGDGSYNCSSVAKQVYGLENIASISAGEHFSLAVKKDGSLYSWGRYNAKELGIDSTVSQNIPVQATKLNNVTVVNAAMENGAALRNDGTVWGWGETFVIGDPRVNITQVKDLDEIKAIDSQMDLIVAVRQDGSVWVWHYYYFLPAYSSMAASIRVKNLTDVADIKIARSGYCLVALKKDGTVWLSDAGIYNHDTEALQLKELNDIVSINMSYAVTKDGNVWDITQCVRNYENRNMKQLHPVKVKALDKIKAISMFSLLEKDGTVRAWGDNTFGLRGNGTSDIDCTPVKIFNGVIK